MEPRNSSEEQFQNLFEQSRDGIIIYDLEGRIQDVNSQMYEMLGYVREDMLNRFVSDFRPDELDEYIDKVYDELVEAGSVRFESQFIKTTGEVVDVDVSASIFDAKLGLGQAIVRDMTEYKKIDEDLRKANEELELRVEARTAELRESEHRFRTIVEGVTDALFIHDHQGHFVDVNQQACESLGYTREELLERYVFDVDVDFPKEKLAELVEGLPREGSVIVVGTHKRKDGSRFPVEIRVGRMMLDGEDVVMAMARDLTERKQLEEQLLQSQKMQAVGKLAGGIAHDFNNLLTAINGYSAQLVKHLDGQDSLRGLAEQVHRAGDRATALTNQLLAFSRQQTLQPKVLDLNNVLVDMLKLLQRLIGEDIDLVASLGASYSQVKADPNQLEQVIMNLAINARDAMPTGGSLTIKTNDVVLDVPFVQQHEGIAPGNYVELVVVDTGYGMDEETVAHIFDPFFTTKELGQGTGLGLSMVYGIVTQSGGCITVESAPEEGTMFQIYLPRHDAEMENLQEEEAELLAGENETILLVEDEELVREFTHHTLEDLGYVVLTAANGASALELFELHNGSVDLLLTDVVMPQMSGRELAEQLVMKRPGLKVLFMSGYTHDFIGRHGVLDSDVAFLQKPYEAEDLSRKLREILDTD